MTLREFLVALKSTVNSYRWVYEGNSLVGTAKYGADRGVTYNPVTAVARTLRVGNYPNTKAGTSHAAKALGLTDGLVSAVLSQSNRGHAQIIRGKLLETLFN